MTRTELPGDHRALVFSLADGRPLLERICRHLGVEPGRHEEREFEDGEHKIRPLQSVRGRDVFVVESLVGGEELSVNDKLMRMLFFLGALKDAGASRVTAVVPYLCYARKDMRTKSRDPVTTRYVAQLFEAVGTDRMVVVDVHNRAAFQNAFRIPTEHLTAAPIFVEAMAPIIRDEQVVVVSPDAGGVKRAEAFRQTLEGRINRDVGSAFIEKFRSEGKIRGGTVVGDVDGKAVIIIDDLISSGSTLARAAASCRERGASVVYAAATHGVFSADTEEVLTRSEIERLFIVDTIEPGGLSHDFMENRLEVIDCAPLLAEAIFGLYER